MARKRVSRPEEIDLIQRLRRGDQQARTKLVQRHHAALLHHAFLVLGNKALAEDVVQDAWVAAFRSIDGFNGRSSLCTWLVRIVINRARCQQRRENRSLPFSAVVHPSSRWSGASAEEEAEGLGASDLTPERHLLEQEAHRRFVEALQALPEDQRSVLILRDLRGVSSAEACRVSQIDDLTHRVRLCRARATLRSALQDSRRLAA